LGQSLLFRIFGSTHNKNNEKVHSNHLIPIMFVKILLAFTLSFLVVAQSAGLYGWDTYSASNDVVSCLQGKNDAQFIIFPAKDTTICAELKSAMDNGIAHRDVKFIPCPTCSASAQSQISTVTNTLNSCTSGAWSGRMWLDTQSNQLWPTPWRDAGK
jgi:hypothetical protein